MISQRCDICKGLKQIMGGGMIMKNCERCNGTGKNAVINKNDESYLNAKKKIKNLSDSMSDDEAEKLLDEELERQGNDKRKRRKD